MAKTKKLDRNVWNGILYILVGVLFCVFRAATLQWLLTIVGILFLVQGVLSITKKDTYGGAISLVLGLLLILGGWLFVEIVLIVFGVLIIVKGVMDLTEALKHKKNLLPIVVACVTLAVGILLIVSRWAMLDWFFILLGIFFVVDGVLALMGKK